MITRHDIRIKVFQQLYKSAVNPSNIHNTKHYISFFEEDLQKSVNLFNYICLLITKIVQYANIDELKKSQKFLPENQNQFVNLKLADSVFIKELSSSIQFINIKGYKPEADLDHESIKNWYFQFINTPNFKEFSNLQSNSNEKKIIGFLWETILLEDESFWSHLELKYPSFESDLEWIIIRFDNFIKNLEKHISDPIIDDEKRNFGIKLFSLCFEKNDDYDSIINPKLMNWKEDRLAKNDLILCKMAITEFLYFETIPAKVTLNEYIDIAKMYSTEKSGRFINGLLDSILKDLEQQGKVEKIAFTKLP
ncbi:MAG: transcription antitermination factor NusB [Alphaproteobacteria bacterium]|nr:transcription antitermination factor NusB [Alphaproteobacteria bacterium]